METITVCFEDNDLEKRYYTTYILPDQVDDFIQMKGKHCSDAHTKFLKWPKGKGPGREPKHNTSLLTY